MFIYLFIRLQFCIFISIKTYQLLSKHTILSIGLLLFNNDVIQKNDIIFKKKKNRTLMHFKYATGLLEKKILYANFPNLHVFAHQYYFTENVLLNRMFELSNKTFSVQNTGTEKPKIWQLCCVLFYSYNTLLNRSIIASFEKKDFVTQKSEIICY